VTDDCCFGHFATPRKPVLDAVPNQFIRQPKSYRG